MPLIDNRGVCDTVMLQPAASGSIDRMVELAHREMVREAGDAGPAIARFRRFVDAQRRRRREEAMAQAVADWLGAGLERCHAMLRGERLALGRGCADRGVSEAGLAACEAYLGFLQDELNAALADGSLSLHSRVAQMIAAECAEHGGLGPLELPVELSVEAVATAAAGISVDDRSRAVRRERTTAPSAAGVDLTPPARAPAEPGAGAMAQRNGLPMPAKVWTLPHAIQSPCAGCRTEIETGAGRNTGPPRFT